MQIKQFEDKNLSHYSYAVLSECEAAIILIDPARNTKQYFDYATENNATIKAVIETHPHADFVSGHLELHQQTNATIYTSKLSGALYPHQTFDDGQSIEIGKIKLSAVNTPGHSPDSICILLEHDHKQHAVFTGDTLFIGDCGRPDLREGAGKIQTTRIELAKQLYHSLRDKLMQLDDEVLVYPAHGAGTLCGKNVSKENSSTIKKEKETNWCLQQQTEEEFINNLLAGQPFVPQYFSYDVALNRKGVAAMQESINTIKCGEVIDKNSSVNLNKTLWIIDIRSEEDFKDAHLPHSINLMQEGKFETWLGSIIQPKEQFYLISKTKVQLQTMLERTAAIGYETQVLEAFVFEGEYLKDEKLNLQLFKNNQQDYTIVDVRNDTEVKQEKIFPHSISISLPELRNRVHEIPTNKPIVVHCAGGYRSAAASSLIQSMINGKAQVFDLGEAIKDFQ